MSHKYWTTLAAALSLTSLFIALCSCTGDLDERGGTLPPVTPVETISTSRTPDTSSSETEQARIRAAYIGFLGSYVRAQRVSPPLRTKYLAQWLAEPRLTATVHSLAYDDRHYIRTVGADRPHIMSIEQVGNSATVKDCLDRTHIYIVDSRTGRHINGGRGIGHFWVMTKLRKTTLGWRVYATVHEPKRCAY